ncbi:MAG: DUF2269 family protein [Nitrososphaeraceae archaeon]|nr:DUF2269 family protein [Nitrososphaeraceae archaeon]
MVYLLLKLIHIIAVVIFLGNITLAPFWKRKAEQSMDRSKLADTFEGIIKADRYFTMPGVTVLIIFGIGNALHAGYNLIETGWIFWSIILLLISSAAFMARVVPLQKKIFALASDEKKFNWDEYKKLAKQWSIWGWLATFTPWLALIMMVMRHPA